MEIYNDCILQIFNNFHELGKYTRWNLLRDISIIEISISCMQELTGYRRVVSFSDCWSILSLRRRAPRREERRSAQRRATGSGVAARALPSRRPGHRSSSPATLAGCRCPAWRALREVPKCCLRASYTRATIDRAPSPKARFWKTFSLANYLLYIVPRFLSFLRSIRSTSFTASLPDFCKRKRNIKKEKRRKRRYQTRVFFRIFSSNKRKRAKSSREHIARLICTPSDEPLSNTRVREVRVGACVYNLWVVRRRRR